LRGTCARGRGRVGHDRAKSRSGGKT
jgi:hypothetical protein